ncbi:MAG TPA: hypothetical protein VGF45_09875 [Polyangia bacterium]
MSGMPERIGKTPPWDSLKPARPRRWRKRALSSLLVFLGAWLGASGGAEASRRVFLWFADGGVPPTAVGEICLGGRPPPFRCVAGPVDTCRQEILGWLDRWYADADVLFTFAEPTEGPFDTVALTSDGAWCDADARTVSRSPLPLCTAVPRGSIAIFRCGEDAKACATLVAKEQAHLLGLQHTGSANDVMNEYGGTLHDGFEDRDNPLTSARCGRQQNSLRLLLERAGRWPGGPKPPPALPMAAPPDAAVDAEVSVEAGNPETDAHRDDGAAGGAFDAGEGVGSVGDGAAPPGDVPVAIPPAPPSKSTSGGCSFGGSGGATPAGGAVVALVTVAARVGRKRRPSRRRS